MRQSIHRMLWSGLLAAVLGFTAGGATAAESSYRQIVDGVAVYFGILPAELVRGHPPEHAEGQMHGGVPVGENHIVVVLFEEKTGKRLAGAEINARITGDRGFDVRKKLESMEIAGSVSYGNYFSMPGAGPYHIEVRIRLPGAARELRATFTWARS